MSVPTERVISDRRLAEAARYLARLAAREGGHTLRGVSGWAHTQDVTRDGGSVLDVVMEGQLPRLYEMGLAEREKLKTGAAAGEAWVYRITDAGAPTSAQTWGEPYAGVREPGAVEGRKPVYLPRGQRSTLGVLRAAYESAPVRFGERGWRTGRELTDFKDRLNDEQERNGGPLYWRVDTGDLNGLVSAGLAERRDEELAWGRSGLVVYWRASKAGRDAVVLEWREPRGDDDEPAGSV